MTEAATPTTETPDVPEVMTVWKCPECDELFSTPDEDPLYECNCGSTFLRSESDSGNHRSPCCGKFSTKLGNYGCPNGCGVALEEVEVQVDDLTDEQKEELGIGDDEDF